MKPLFAAFLVLAGCIEPPGEVHDNASDAGSERDDLRLSDPAPLVADQWTHVAFSWRDGRTELYRDAVRVDFLEQGWGIVGNSEPVAVGFSSQVSGTGSVQPAEDFLKGMLDDVTIWDRPLTASEVAKLAAPDCVVPSL